MVRWFLLIYKGEFSATLKRGRTLAGGFPFHAQPAIQNFLSVFSPTLFFIIIIPKVEKSHVAIIYRYQRNCYTDFSDFIIYEKERSKWQ